MIREINVEEAMGLLDSAIFIDVRSPSEYKEDTIPGAINIPLLDDNERKIVGLTYKNIGSTAAKRKALELFAPRIYNFIGEFIKYENKKVVVFCWRGGYRSQNVCNLLNMVDIPAIRIKGGYKAYRKYVYNFFYETNTLIENLYVLDGLTGVGKTQIIKQLPQYGIKTIDLEGLANNRGSVFGDLGFNHQPSQKFFESMLFKKIYSKKEKTTPIVIEGESKRIGRLFIPKALWKSMQSAKRIWIYDNLENRIKRIMNEYVYYTDVGIKDYEQAIKRLKVRLGKDKIDELISQLHNGEFESVILFLLQNYYDVIYKVPENSRYILKVKSTKINDACRQIYNLIHNNNIEEEK